MHWVFGDTVYIGFPATHRTALHFFYVCNALSLPSLAARTVPGLPDIVQWSRPCLAHQLIYLYPTPPRRHLPPTAWPSSSSPPPPAAATAAPPPPTPAPPPPAPSPRSCRPPTPASAALHAPLAPAATAAAPTAWRAGAAAAAAAARRRLGRGPLPAARHCVVAALCAGRDERWTKRGEAKKAQSNAITLR